jgi:hypothetical protein
MIRRKSRKGRNRRDGMSVGKQLGRFKIAKISDYNPNDDILNLTQIYPTILNRTESHDSDYTGVIPTEKDNLQIFRNKRIKSRSRVISRGKKGSGNINFKILDINSLFEEQHDLIMRLLKINNDIRENYSNKIVDENLLQKLLNYQKTILKQIETISKQISENII